MMNQTTQPLLYPQFTYVTASLPQPNCMQVPVLPGYTPCILGENGAFHALQMPSLPTMSYLQPTPSQISPCPSPFVSPMLQPAISGLALSSFNLDNDFGRTDSPNSVYSDYSSDSETFQSLLEDEEDVEIPTPKTKEQIVPEKLDIISQMFAGCYDEEGMRGTDIARIKVKTINALNHIVELLEYLKTHLNINHVSCPKSTKNGGSSVRGFICYLKVAQSDLPQLQMLFNVYNIAGAFHPMDVNPQKKC